MPLRDRDFLRITSQAWSLHDRLGAAVDKSLGTLGRGDVAFFYELVVHFT